MSGFVNRRRRRRVFRPHGPRSPARELARAAGRLRPKCDPSRAPPRPAASRQTKGTNRASGRNTRATQALELVQAQPGITIPQLADAMKIQPNYLYRVLPRLASQGQVKRDGQGWRPA